MANNSIPPYPRGGDGSTMWAVDISSPAGQRAAELVHSIPGRAGTPNLRRLKRLFETERDPSPVAIYRAYHGDVEFERVPGARTSNSAQAEEFDPATDPAPSTDKVRVKRAYELALTQDLEETAAFLRTSAPAHQRGFAGFLFAESRLQPAAGGEAGGGDIDVPSNRKGDRR